jgi:hypothetical protein
LTFTARLNLTQNTAMDAIPEPTKLIHLMQCAKQCCGHVLIESEREWVPSRCWKGANDAVCPKCGGASFFTLNAQGQCRMQRDTGPREIDPNDISPSLRMGLKMKRRLFAAKKRALQSIATP